MIFLLSLLGRVSTISFVPTLVRFPSVESRPSAASIFPAPLYPPSFQRYVPTHLFLVVEFFFFPVATSFPLCFGEEDHPLTPCSDHAFLSDLLTRSNGASLLLFSSSFLSGRLDRSVFPSLPCGTLRSNKVARPPPRFPLSIASARSALPGSPPPFPPVTFRWLLLSWICVFFLSPFCRSSPWVSPLPRPQGWLGSVPSFEIFFPNLKTGFGIRATRQPRGRAQGVANFSGILLLTFFCFFPCVLASENLSVAPARLGKRALPLEARLQDAASLFFFFFPFAFGRAADAGPVLEACPFD